MSPATASCSKIRHIVRIRHMLLRWRNKARATVEKSPTSDVPAGHVAVIVGATRRRFIVRMEHLNHPIFHKLLTEAEEEYGFCTQGPLTIPCHESLFEEAIRVISGSEHPTRFVCHVDAFGGFDISGGESRPLLHEAPIC